MQISLLSEAKIFEKTSVLLVREAKILEKTSVFRVLVLKIVEKTSVFRDLDRQVVSRESPGSLQSVLRAFPEQILEKIDKFGEQTRS